MADFEPVLLKRINAKASPWLDAYRADGGYRAIAKALNGMTPAQVIDTVKASGSARCGGRGFSRAASSGGVSAAQPSWADLSVR